MPTLAIDSSIHSAIERFIAAEHLPPGYHDTVTQWFLPLAEELLQLIAGSRQAPLVGISGCQGSGKSTLAALLVLLLRALMGLKAVNLSLDDFYLTRAERQRLALGVHPLLATRGVPGTHDVALALQTIEALRQDGVVAIPRFDKAVDDRVAPERWPRVQAPLDCILLEGWCLGVGPQQAEELAAPLNELETNEDPDGTWRRYVNASNAGAYAELYGRIDRLIMLKAPDFGKVFEWRQKQEDKLAASAGGQGTHVMNRAQLRRFIQHYERLTRHGLVTLPARADVVFELTGEQTIAGKLKDNKVLMRT